VLLVVNPSFVVEVLLVVPVVLSTPSVVLLRPLRSLHAVELSIRHTDDIKIIIVK